MKLFPWILAVSLTANVVMAGLWLQERLDRAERSSTVRRESAPRAASMPANSGAAADSAPAKRNATEISPRMSWKDLQSDDLKEWIRRLRAVDCPEETIQDL